MGFGKIIDCVDYFVEFIDGNYGIGLLVGVVLVCVVNWWFDFGIWVVVGFG